MKTNIPGLLEDDRSEEQKSLDFKSINPELASIGDVIWIEKKNQDWKRYPARYQISSSSCVAQSYAKAMYILYQKDILSALPLYRNRKNFSGQGMYLYDAGDIAKKIGTTTESIAPSQYMTEEHMNQNLNASVINALQTNPIKIGAYVYVDKNDFTSIARAVQDNNHCLITVGSNNKEWNGMPTVTGNVEWGHCVVVVDFCLFYGKKYLVIEDSLGASDPMFGERKLLSEEFINARCTGAMYLMSYVDSTNAKFKFTKTLKKGDVGVAVQNLQLALQKLGFFPPISTTLFYGVITENAVKKFQMMYKDEILKPVGLDQPTGNFGEYTMAKLNQLTK